MLSGTLPQAVPGYLLFKMVSIGKVEEIFLGGRDDVGEGVEAVLRVVHNVKGEAVKGKEKEGKIVGGRCG